MKRFILLITALVISAPVVFGAVCTPSTLNACSVNISQDHNGGVELCSDCFVCGADDGVCPEDYATGEIETREERMYVPLRAANGLRPGNDYYQNNDRANIYSNGDQACAEIMGECSMIYSFTESGGWDKNQEGIECDTSTTSSSFNENLNYRAICEDVSRTASCGLCSDPDCLSEIQGFVFSENESTGDLTALESALVSTYHPANTGLDIESFSGSSNEWGYYNFEGMRGQDILFCGADRHNPKFGNSDVIRGDNIVDCMLSPASCNSNCTLPNRRGEAICRSDCDGKKGCDYPNEEEITLQSGRTLNVSAKEYCAEQRLGSFSRVGRMNETHVGGFRCCTGEFTTVFSSRLNIDVTANVRNLITREYSRVLDTDDTPVKLIIIAYD